MLFKFSCIMYTYKFYSSNNASDDYSPYPSHTKYGYIYIYIYIIIILVDNIINLSNIILVIKSLMLNL